MTRILPVLRNRGIDILTTLCFLLAAYFLVQPGSALRNRWDAYRRAQAMKSASRQEWSKLQLLSTPLFSDASGAQVVEVSDYECPFCRRSSAAVDSAVQRGVRVAYLNYPLEIHVAAEGAARSALCAAEQGRFREMHARLMTTDGWKQDTNWVRVARGAGLPDTAAFASCLHSERISRRLQEERRLVSALHVQGTPTFVAAGAVHEGAATTRDLLSLNVAVRNVEK